MTLLVFLGYCSLQIVAAVKQKIEVSSLGHQHMASGKELRASFAHRLNRSADDSHGLSEKEEVSSNITVPAGEGADKYVFMARLAWELERYDDMIVHVRAAVSKQPDGLSPEVRDLLSTAYRSALQDIRHAWRVISQVEEEHQGSRNAEHAKEYRLLIETEIRNECEDIIGLLDARLISTATGDVKLQYLKMKGDYLRYIAELTAESSETARRRKDDAKKAYEEAKDFAEEPTNNVKKTNVHLLGLLLNSSVFYYDILKEFAEARAMAVKAYNDASAELNKISDRDHSKDVAAILQLIKNNLSLWSSNGEGERLW